MKSCLRLLALIVLGLTALSTQAQVTYSNPPGSQFFDAVDATTAYGQTFTNLDSVASVSWYLGPEIGGLNSDFQMFIYEWNTGTNTTTGAAIYSSVAQSYANNSAGDLTFSSIGTMLNSGDTYVMLLTYVSGSQQFDQAVGSPGYVDGSFFSSGNAVRTDFTAGNGPNGSAYAGTFTNLATNDLIMSVTDIAPVPEPKTAAAGIAALFIAGLVGRQLWLRRKAAAPTQAAA